LKVYFAGPDVFLPNYDAFVQKMKARAIALGLQPIFPGDTVLDGAAEIVSFNLASIRGTDLVIANLNPFRGLEPDSGTVFECGYAVSQGKKVLAHVTDHRDLLTKLRAWPQGPGPDSTVCSDGSQVENFGHPLNIMLSLTLSGLYQTLEQAMEAAAALGRTSTAARMAETQS
jgi:nucleoside 2-deoxyribosyltransferase